MKSKVLFQGAFMTVLFFGLWFGLSQVPWTKIFKVEEKENELDKKLGKLVWENIENTENILYDDYVQSCLDSIVNRIAEDNEMDEKKFKVHIIEQSEINAFALPGGHIIIYSKLIEDAENADELAGVMGHEMAHIQLNHIMKRLVREFGLTILLSAGGGNSGIISEIMKNLTASSFNRDEESEADFIGAGYLIHAKIDPRPMADFLYRMSLDESGMSDMPEWIMSHPDSEGRAMAILDLSKKEIDNFKPALKTSTFDSLKSKVNEFDNHFLKQEVEFPDDGQEDF